MLVLSSLARLDDDVLIGGLRTKGVAKFIAYELPIDEVERHYGGHYQATIQDPQQGDELRVLDVDGQRIFERVRLDRLGEPFIYEPAGRPNKVFLD